MVRRKRYLLRKLRELQLAAERKVPNQNNAFAPVRLSLVLFSCSFGFSLRVCVVPTNPVFLVLPCLSPSVQRDFTDESIENFETVVKSWKTRFIHSSDSLTTDCFPSGRRGIRHGGRGRPRGPEPRRGVAAVPAHAARDAHQRRRALR